MVRLWYLGREAHQRQALYAVFHTEAAVLRPLSIVLVVDTAIVVTADIVTAIVVTTVVIVVVVATVMSTDQWYITGRRQRNRG